MDRLVIGFVMGLAVGAALVKLVEEIQRLRAYERARESLRRFIQGEEP